MNRDNVDRVAFEEWCKRWNLIEIRNRFQLALDRNCNGDRDDYLLIIYIYLLARSPFMTPECLMAMTQMKTKDLE